MSQYHIRGISYLVFSILSLIVMSAQTSSASTLQEQKKALTIINDFAERFCEDIPLTGDGRDLELTGRAKAELNRFLNKLINVGVEGAVKYKDHKYKGVLQKDLINAIKNSTDCRMLIWGDLIDRLLPSKNSGIYDKSSKFNKERTANSSIATKTYWNSLLSIEDKFFIKAIENRVKAHNIIISESGDFNLFIVHTKESAKLMNQYVREIEKLSSLNVDSELLSLTVKSTIIESDWASQMSYWASLWERPDLIRKFNLQKRMSNEQNKTMDKIGDLEKRRKDNSNEFRLLRIKLMSKYKIDLALQ